MCTQYKSIHITDTKIGREQPTSNQTVKIYKLSI